MLIPTRTDIVDRMKSFDTRRPERSKAPPSAPLVRQFAIVVVQFRCEDQTTPTRSHAPSLRRRWSGSARVGTQAPFLGRTSNFSGW